MIYMYRHLYAYCVSFCLLHLDVDNLDQVGDRVVIEMEAVLDARFEARVVLGRKEKVEDWCGSAQ